VIGRERGRLQRAKNRTAMITVHPSAILRIRDSQERAAAQGELAADLRSAASAVAEPPGPGA
jgi:uracil-DNA glycosylase